MSEHARHTFLTLVAAKIIIEKRHALGWDQNRELLAAAAQLCGSAAIFDPFNRPVTVTDKLTHMLGCTPADLALCQSALSTVLPEDHRNYKAARASAMASSASWLSPGMRWLRQTDREIIAVQIAQLPLKHGYRIAVPLLCDGDQQKNSLVC